ncbi:hypothetical protein Scep_020451 [Stephania cephalantha]|uniref:RNA helicase n=1 Tax=Stephania cephalantha TaxID=152367 RepID=A0AAP0ICY4_9MAGN
MSSTGGGGGDGVVVSAAAAVNRWNGRPYSQTYHKISNKRTTLPIRHKKDDFLQLLNTNQTLIVVAPPGSGKSTQIPQFVLESLYRHDRTDQKMMIGCTQPRRLAAMSVSRRVAAEMDVAVGEEVGYKIRYQDCSGERTVVKYLTDGALVREAMADPWLARYKVVIVDEAHERSLGTDVLLGIMKESVLRNRPDLKLVVMSATASEGEKVQAYFNGAAALMKVPREKAHPVEIVYAQESVRDYLGAAVRKAVEVHLCEPPGDVLVFVAGEEEIEAACREIDEQVGNLGGDRVGPVKVVALHSALLETMQEEIFDHSRRLPPGRMIVVSTSIAETSLAIDGIVYVIDPGFDKQNVESLVVSPISKARALQRSGVAGRTQAGKCFRLYTERTFNDEMPTETDPEILRSNLANVVLTLKKMGIHDLVHFGFMDPPAPEALTRALEELNGLGALDDEGNLTKLGEMMSEFPLEPQLSKKLVVSPEFNCSNEILSILSMLSVPNCFLRPREEAQKAAADEAKARFSHIDGNGDHLTLLNVYNAYKQNEDPQWCLDNFVDPKALKAADNVRQQLARIMARLNLKLCSTDVNNTDYYVNIRKAMQAGG